MLSLQWIQLRCPVCETTSESLAAVVDTAGDTADDGAAAPVATPAIAAGLLPYLVHVCRRCGYAGATEEFGNGQRVGAHVRARVWRELAPTLAPSVRMPWLILTAPGSEKYEGAA